MLKLIYSEAGLQLEQVTQPLERWLSQRVMLSLQAGEQLFVEPCTASVLLPASLAELQMLRATVPVANAPPLELSLCDAETVEVSLRGTWLSAGSQRAEGVFVTVLGDRLECLIFKLWQASQCCMPPLKG
jgi:hypothetical protein